MTGSDPGPRRAQLVLAVCCMSLLITVVDTTAVNVALPAIGHDLNAPVSGLQWTIDGYTLAIASFMMRRSPPRSPAASPPRAARVPRWSPRAS